MLSPPSLACRLGMMWPGVEPQKGQYNYTYLKVARDITNKCVGICMKGGGGEVGAVEG